MANASSAATTAWRLALSTACTFSADSWPCPSISTIDSFSTHSAWHAKSRSLRTAAGSTSFKALSCGDEAEPAAAVCAVKDPLPLLPPASWPASIHVLEDAFRNRRRRRFDLSRKRPHQNSSKFQPLRTCGPLCGDQATVRKHKIQIRGNKRFNQQNLEAQVNSPWRAMCASLPSLGQIPLSAWPLTAASDPLLAHPVGARGLSTQR